MIEPYETEKRCSKCRAYKPLSAFSPCAKAAHGVHAYCRACRCEQARLRGAMGLRKDRQKRKPQPVVWPRQLGEALLDVGARKWRGPVDRSRMLRWAA